MLREQRGGLEAPGGRARKGAPVALLDTHQYASMHPEEHAELTLGGFKMSCAEITPRSRRDRARRVTTLAPRGRYATLGPKVPESP